MNSDPYNRLPHDAPPIQKYHRDIHPAEHVGQIENGNAQRKK